MSYALSEALQVAVFAQLSNDTQVASLSGGAIYDAMPSGTVPALYLALGEESVRDRSDISGRGAEHDLTVTVHASSAGFRQAKELAAAVSAALDDAPLSLSAGRCVGISFLKAQATRDGTGDQRRIVLTFRARVAE